MVGVHLPPLGDLAVENIDVFCEKGVFEIEDSRKIMEVKKSHMDTFKRLRVFKACP